MAEKKASSKVKSGHVRTSFDIPKDLHLRAKLHSVRSGTDLRDLFNEWIKRGLDADESGKSGKR